ncbi:D,D-heptose 1,7-bisphosphate phosphatase [Leclercia adecarboxylata]|uniref:D-glycero-beta-D-manno-heptose-1,7-bisphosphate 7-phosphatase n=1 Tax=Leclercia adecarboxylata TaxID=83655 RepID=A0A4U9HJX1_9ENTR|nr:D,D-heptose 1,7-bisphosphate phosphatase [Leclercia adecarboxylata]
MAKSVPAIFLDRDGTINVDHGYVHEIDEFEFIDGVIDAMRELKEMGFALVVVTNQSGIARGKFTEAQFETLTEWMDWSLADRGVDLDGIYYCPHHPQGTVDEYRQTCDCRKPASGHAHLGTRVPSYRYERFIYGGRQTGRYAGSCRSRCRS